MYLTKNASTKQPKVNSILNISTQVNDKNKVKTNLTRVVVHYDVGFNNSVFIRGNGPTLSWDKGIMLHNTSSDEWVWESDAAFDLCEFKVLINDSHYEQGDNHTLTCEKTFDYTPVF